MSCIGSRKNDTLKNKWAVRTLATRIVNGDRVHPCKAHQRPGEALSSCLAVQVLEDGTVPLRAHAASDAGLEGAELGRKSTFFHNLLRNTHTHTCTFI